MDMLIWLSNHGLIKGKQFNILSIFWITGTFRKCNSNKEGILCTSHNAVLPIEYFVQLVMIVTKCKIRMTSDN